MPRATINVTDPLAASRTWEPVQFTVDDHIDGALWLAETSDGQQVVCQRLTAPSAKTQTTFITTMHLAGRTELSLLRPISRDQAPYGIRQLEPQETDAFARLDTGYFDLEMCSGTGQGTGSSKWGLRHFARVAEGVDLLPSGNNAIGGFYGPFFTPENGLINPPEHTKVAINVIEEGPVLHHYQMRGTIPDGLLPELHGKHFTIDWQFTYGTSHFRRTYQVDPFQTVINGRSITNKITVGDEFESGQGSVVFDRFEQHADTRYRDGDPYAGELAAMVHKTLASPGSTSERFQQFKNALDNDITSAHWDLYWRLFSTWEAALSDQEIRHRLGAVCATSHVLADLPNRPWIISAQPVNVSSADEETIFAGPASKTAEFNSVTGQTMIWYTSKPSGAFQIVQRPQSGWVNWGTNSENECPELPVGVEIKTSYGQFDNWQTSADALETEPVATTA